MSEWVLCNELVVYTRKNDTAAIDYFFGDVFETRRETIEDAPARVKALLDGGWFVDSQFMTSWGTFSRTFRTSTNPIVIETRWRQRNRWTPPPVCHNF